MFPINGTFSQQPENKTSKTSFQNIAQISLSSPIPVSSSLSPYASITSNLILSCGLISLKASVRYSLSFNLGTLIKFFFLLAFFFSQLVLYLYYLIYPCLAVLDSQSDFSSVGYRLCYSCLHLLTERTVELVLLYMCSVLVVAHCELCLNPIFQYNYLIDLKHPMFGNTPCTASQCWKYQVHYLMVEMSVIHLPEIVSLLQFSLFDSEVHQSSHADIHFGFLAKAGIKLFDTYKTSTTYGFCTTDLTN